MRKSSPTENIIIEKSFFRFGTMAKHVSIEFSDAVHDHDSKFY